MAASLKRSAKCNLLDATVRLTSCNNRTLTLVFRSRGLGLSDIYPVGLQGKSSSGFRDPEFTVPVKMLYICMGLHGRVLTVLAPQLDIHNL